MSAVAAQKEDCERHDGVEVVRSDWVEAKGPRYGVLVVGHRCDRWRAGVDESVLLGWCCVGRVGFGRGK